MTEYNLKIVKTYDEPFDCEDCGMCYPEGLYIEFNNEVIWEKFSDGHYSGHQTEDTILNCILNKWFLDAQVAVEYSHTEEKRQEWNKNHPGNGIARTPESWLENKKSYLFYLNENLEAIKKDCEHLPYDETLQVKMIALWFESATGEVMNIIEDEEKYSSHD